MLTDKERKFADEQAEMFIERMLNSYEVSSLSSIESIQENPAVPLEPVVISDYKNITQEEKNWIIDQYNSRFAAANFIVLNPDDQPENSHPLLDIADQLVDELDLHFPIKHPLEEHEDRIERFGKPDGTVKIYDRPQSAGGALSSNYFPIHQDGLGNGGNVKVAALYMDSPPLFGGYTYFQNICRLALEIARDDYEAFKSLFLPDALTILRSSGSRAIKITAPILFINSFNDPQAFLRTEGAEYIVTFRDDIEAAVRAKKFLLKYSKPLANASCFVHLVRKGHGCFIQNQFNAHGRTGFHQKNEAGFQRVLARKWWATDENSTEYEHYPGMRIHPKYAELFPELFGSDRLEGEWVYDESIDENKRIK